MSYPSSYYPEGRGSRIFEFNVLIDESRVGPQYDRSLVINLVDRWAPAHTDGGVALVQSDGGIGALCGDVNCIAGLCVSDA